MLNRQLAVGTWFAVFNSRQSTGSACRTNIIVLLGIGVLGRRLTTLPRMGSLPMTSSMRALPVSAVGNYPGGRLQLSQRQSQFSSTDEYRYHEALVHPA